MKMLKLASNLVLSPASVTDTWAWFGARGTGKTYGAGATVEAFIGIGAQVVVIDPVGVWYGLRLAADGRGRGLDIPVFGGLHADVPLEPTGGELVAKIVVEQGVSVVLDVSMMTLGQQHRFALAFATTLYNLKKSSRTPIFVLFDEAHEFAPQQPGPAEMEMLGAVRRLWKMGRNFGIGVGLISQRPAEVNKGIVNLTERMFCGRLKGPHDRKAMESWAENQDTEESALDELPRLASGELMFWPEAEMPKRVRFFPKKTFDASKTPEPGDPRPAGELPKIDLDVVREAMAATIEEAKANDPRALRAQIADLERQLAKAPAAAPPKEIIREVAAIPSEILSLAVATSPAFLQARAAVVELERAVDTLQGVVDSAVKQIGQAQARRIPPPPSAAARLHLASASVPVAAKRATSAAPAGMTKAARAVLTALAQHQGGLTRRKLGILAGYAPAGTSMREALALCRKEGWVSDLHTGDICITEKGHVDLGAFAPLPTGAALREYWFGELPTGAARILRAVCVARPGGLTKDEIAEATARDGGKTAYTAGGTSMREALAMLRGLELVDDVGDRIVAADALF